MPFSGVKTPRLSKSKNSLPNVRDLRTSLFPEKVVPDNIHTLNVMEWGQVVSHDTSHIITEGAGEAILFSLHTIFIIINISSIEKTFLQMLLIYFNVQYDIIKS